MICLTIALVLGRLKTVESLKLILAPRLHSVSNRAKHFRIPMGPIGGRFRWARRNKHRFYDFIRSIFTWVDRSYIAFESHGQYYNNYYIRTAGECFRGVGSGQSCRSELYSVSLAANMEWCFKMIVKQSLHQTGCQCDHHASCSTSSSTSWTLTHVYTRTYTHIHALQ